MLKLRGGVWWVDTYVGGRRIRKSTGETEQARALAAASTILGAPTVRGQGPEDGQTIEEAYKEALRTRRKWRDAKDQRSITGLYDAVAKHFGLQRALSTITREEVLQWIERMRKQDLSASTINHRLSLLSVLFKTADVPMPRIERMTVRQGRVRIVAQAELDAMCDWARVNQRHDFGSLLVFLSHTALRLSEALRLRWDCMNGGCALIHETKADLPRTVPLSEGASAALLWGNRGADGPWTNLTVDRCDKLWARARAAIGLANDPQFVIHALRHTSLTRLAQAGVDAMRIKAFAGHKRIETTQRYVHLSGHDLRDLARVQDGLPMVGSQRGNDRLPGSVPTVNPQVPGSSPGRGAKTSGPQDESIRSRCPTTVTVGVTETGPKPRPSQLPRFTIPKL